MGSKTETEDHMMRINTCISVSVTVAHDLLISSSSTSAVRRFDAEVVEKKYSPLSPAEPHLDTSS